MAYPHCAEAQQSLSAEKFPSVGDCLPVLEKLQSKWGEMAKDPRYEPVKAGLQSGITNLAKWYQKVDATDAYFIAVGM